jgi:exodeoxyribonuclease VII small subunit
MSTQEPTPPEEIGFAGCLQELDDIVRALESDDIDVDDLTEQVERASELVNWCRSRLDATRLTVTEVLDRMDVDGEGRPKRSVETGGAEGEG